jgi:HK97 family phage prohead protease
LEKGNVCENFIIKADNLEKTIISGYASVFDTVDSQNDMVEKGAFENIKSENIKLLWQHDVSRPIGVIKSACEDDYGLKIEAEINNKTTCGKEASELIKQKAVDGLSIGFCTEDFEYNNQGIRLLKRIDLMEISIVTFPSNKRAGIRVVKADSGANSSLDRLEKLLQTLVNLK